MNLLNLDIFFIVLMLVTLKGFPFSYLIRHFLLLICDKPYIDSSLFTKTRIFSIIGIGLSVCHIVESKDVKRTIIPLICGVAALLLTFIVF